VGLGYNDCSQPSDNSTERFRNAIVYCTAEITMIVVVAAAATYHIVSLDGWVTPE